MSWFKIMIIAFAFAEVGYAFYQIGKKRQVITFGVALCILIVQCLLIAGYLKYMN